jgi:hypothetical protein
MLIGVRARLDPTWNNEITKKIKADRRMLAALRGEILPPDV